jgi:F-type H+-transporting ATPase subunit alpha
MAVPVGEGLLGRIVNPIGLPVDGKGPDKGRLTRMVESVAPSIISRTPVIYH